MNIFQRTCSCLLLCSVVFLEFACSSGPKTPPEAPKYGTPTKVKSDFKAQRARGGAVKFEFNFQTPHDTSSADFNFVFHISDCYCVVRTIDQVSLDTIDLHPAFGITNVDPDKDSLTVSAHGFWLNATTEEYNDLIFDLVFTVDGALYHDTRIVHMEPTKDEERAFPLITVKGFIDEQSDSSVVFALLATRNRGASIDYFPTSEKMRIEIMNMKGVVLYASNQGQMYLQEVKPVDPLKLNEFLRYTLAWNGKQNDGSVLPDGKYKVRLSLVARPKAYVDEIDLDWKGRQP